MADSPAGQSATRPRKRVRIGLRIKVILVTVASLLLSIPVSNWLDTLLHAMVTSHIGVYINTVVSLVVSTVLIAVFTGLLVIRPLGRIRAGLREVASGDLTVHFTHWSRDEIGTLAGMLNKTVSQLRTLIADIQEAAHQVGASAEELTASATENAKTNEQITETMQSTAHQSDVQVRELNLGTDGMREVVQSAAAIANRAQSMAASSEAAVGLADTGVTAANDAITGIDSILHQFTDLAGVISEFSQSSKRITEVVQLLTDLANQTNLLALNASIEAARAGEAGKGFAVVAEEVRRLAEQSANSSAEIIEIIGVIEGNAQSAVQAMDASQQLVSDGVSSVRSVARRFISIQQSVDGVVDEIAQVTGATQEISSAAEQVQVRLDAVAELSTQTLKAMQEVAAATEQQMSSTEEITASSSALSDMADGLQKAISGFKL